MLSSLITSQTRIKLLKKFFLNSSTKAHLRGLETEFGESSNGIRVELNRFENAGLLNSLRDGNKKIYQANPNHPLYTDIHNIILKETGIDMVVEKVSHRIGNLDSVYLIGDLAKGKDTPFIDLILVGEKIDRDYLARKVKQAEEIVRRKIKYKILCQSEANKEFKLFDSSDILLLWNNRGTVSG
jgi:hypothetical protein